MQLRTVQIYLLVISPYWNNNITYNRWIFQACFWFILKGISIRFSFGMRRNRKSRWRHGRSPIPTAGQQPTKRLRRRKSFDKLRRKAARKFIKVSLRDAGVCLEPCGRCGPAVSAGWSRASGSNGGPVEALPLWERRSAAGRFRPEPLIINCRWSLLAPEVWGKPAWWRDSRMTLSVRRASPLWVRINWLKREVCQAVEVKLFIEVNLDSYFHIRTLSLLM